MIMGKTPEGLIKMLKILFVDEIWLKELTGMIWDGTWSIPRVRVWMPWNI